MARRSILGQGVLVCAIVAALAAANPARAGVEIAANAYLDKVRGMWLGELLGNYAGAGLVPGTTDVKREGYVVDGGARFDVGWSPILATPTWVGDDDTAMEYMYLDLLKSKASPTAGDIRGAWTSNISATSYYIANRQARWLMEPPPTGASLSPPQTGSITRNVHWSAIDSQIATESIGALLPGSPARAAELCGRLAAVTNDGLAVHAAQFYSAMYAAAATDSDVQSVLGKGLAVVPTTSRTWQVVEGVLDRYQADTAAGLLADPDAWRATQHWLYVYYGSNSTLSHYRYRGWTESAVNVGLTAMALLYGQGDFRRTVEIGVLGGYDADCNPATAGGLVGMIKGYQGAGGAAGGILAELGATPSDAYQITSLAALRTTTSISTVAASFQTAAEAQILAAGGSIRQDAGGRTYVLPDDIAAGPVEKPDPAGPKGLVGKAQAAGLTVTPAASIARHVAGNDRQNLSAIIDGVTDVSYNGHLPYNTNDGGNAQPAGGDYYELRFPRTMTFRSVVYYEGDIEYDGGPNANPRVTEPYGGYFLDLTVEVLRHGQYQAVTGLHFGEPLDPMIYFQRIELTFDPAEGEAIRIRGQAGGAYQFTSIVELEAYGGMGVPGDANEDDVVDAADLKLIEAGMGTAGATWQSGDSNFDGVVDSLDYLALKQAFGPGLASPAGIPEPTTLLLVAALAPMALRRRGCHIHRCFRRAKLPLPLYDGRGSREYGR